MQINKQKIISKISLSKLVIFLTLIGLLHFNNNLEYWKRQDAVIKWDVISYYAYLPAAFIYKDITLKFKDNYEGDKEFKIWAKKTETGNYVLKTTMGAAILYSPFFFAANSYAEIFAYNTGGYSEPYKFALILSSVFYLLLGLIFVRKILKKFFSEFTVGYVILALATGTNLFWYSSFEASMPHTQSFMLISLFILYTIKWHEKAKLKYVFVLGISIGLISLIRPTNMVIALFFILYNFSKISDTKKQTIHFIKYYKHILLIIFLALLIWIPQFLYWKEVTGNYFYNSYGSEERFFFNNPQIINGLFSFRKGMFIYTPVLIFSILGIPLLYKKTQSFFYAVSIFTIINMYVIFSWWSWWYGGSFGQRAFIDSYALSAIPIAAFFEYFIKKKKIFSFSFLVIFNFLILLAVYHTHLYRTEAIHWDGMTKEAYFDSFGRLGPSENFKDLLKHPDYEAAKKGKDNY